MGAGGVGPGAGTPGCSPVLGGRDAWGFLPVWAGGVRGGEPRRLASLPRLGGSCGGEPGPPGLCSCLWPARIPCPSQARPGQGQPPAQALPARAGMPPPPGRSAVPAWDVSLPGCLGSLPAPRLAESRGCRESGRLGPRPSRGVRAVGCREPGSSPPSLPPTPHLPCQARDTQTGDLAAIKIVKLDPGKDWI